MNERIEEIPQNNKMSRASFLKKFSLLVAGTSFLRSKAFSQSEQSQETKKVENPRLEAMPDHNLPEGFSRMHVYAEIDGSKKNIGSANFFESGKAKANFFSNDQHPECFSPEIDYGKIEKVIKLQGNDIVFAFAGAYVSPSGNIEGIAYENGIPVGETEHAPYGGIVYISPDGSLDLLTCKDTNNNFDEAAFSEIQKRAVREGGSFYQQKAAIWNGVQKLFPQNTDPFKMRAICEANDGRKFMINFSEQITQDQFLKSCLSLKDENGNTVVRNLILTDTGECSLGVIRDKKQIASDQSSGTFTYHDMVDSKYENKSKHTNAVIIAQ